MIKTGKGGLENEICRFVQEIWKKKKSLSFIRYIKNEKKLNVTISDQQPHYKCIINFDWNLLTIFHNNVLLQINKEQYENTFIAFHNAEILLREQNEITNYHTSDLHSM